MVNSSIDWWLLIIDFLSSGNKALSNYECLAVIHWSIALSILSILIFPVLWLLIKSVYLQIYLAFIFLIFFSCHLESLTAVTPGHISFSVCVCVFFFSLLSYNWKISDPQPMTGANYILSSPVEFSHPFPWNLLQPKEEKKREKSGSKRNARNG